MGHNKATSASSATALPIRNRSRYIVDIAGRAFNLRPIVDQSLQ